jgi:DNA-binding transcriptional MerR regulator
MPYKEQKVEKLYYPIGEVAEMLNVPVSTVRFWENEFVILKPKKNKKGNRLFTQSDLKNLKTIHFLLKEKGMTIAGVKKTLAQGVDEVDYRLEVSNSLKSIRGMLVELIDSM